MSEYWISKKKYLCKYCGICIADDAPSRQQHENGLRHKGNVERFVRGLYKSGERRKKELEDEKRDIARLELVAQAAFAQDVASGHAQPGSSSHPATVSTSAPTKLAPNSSNLYANYSTAASLGYKDPDAERFAAETERRRTQGVVGEWEVVCNPEATATFAEEDIIALEAEQGEVAEEIAGVKREAETQLDQEDVRHFKLRRKALANGLGELYDPGAIPIKLKKKEVESDPSPLPAASTASTSASSTSTSTASSSSQPVEEKRTGVLKWTAIQWKRVEDDENTFKQPGRAQSVAHGISQGRSLVKAEEFPQVPAPPEWSQFKFQTLADESLDTPVAVAAESHQPSTILATDLEEAKPVVPALEDIPPALASRESTGGMFRKRKAPGIRVHRLRD